MPNIFGFKTPEETAEEIRQKQQIFIANTSNTARSSPERLGVALGGALGRVTRKFMETRKDRKEKAEDYQVMGFTEEAAKAKAKADIEFGYSSVRRAKNLQEASMSSQRVIQELTPSIGPERAMAVGKLQVAEKLRANGFVNEATQMSMEAAQQLREIEAHEANMEKLKVDLDAKKLGMDETAVDIQAKKDALKYAGAKDEYSRLMIDKELLMAEQASAKTDDERNAAARRLGDIAGRMSKLTTVTGTTEFDPNNQKLMNDQIKEVLDLQVFDEQIANSLKLVEGADSSEFSLAGRAKEWWIGAMETTFGREPDEEDAAFVERIRRTKAATTIVAAEVRHAMTGAAMTPYEGAFIEPFIPSVDDSLTVQGAKLRSLREYMTLDRNTRMALIKSESLDQWFGSKTAMQQKLAEDAKKPAEDEPAAADPNVVTLPSGVTIRYIPSGT